MHNLIMNKGMRGRGSTYAARNDLSKSVQQYLHPICTQKILLRYPGKDGQFAAARISLKLEEAKVLPAPALNTSADNLLKPEGGSTPKSAAGKGKDLGGDSQKSTPTKEKTSHSKYEAVHLTPPQKGSRGELTESLAKYLFQENIQLLRQNEAQTSIAYEGPNGTSILQLLEAQEVTLRFCRLCDALITPHRARPRPSPVKDLKFISTLESPTLE